MKTILILIQKEFIQVFRNRIMLPIIFVLPVIQLVIMVYAANLNMKNINLSVADHDHSPVSVKLIDKFKASPFFTVTYAEPNHNAESILVTGNTDILMVIPKGFERNLFREKSSELQLLFDAVNASKAGIAQGYCQGIIADFNQDLFLSEGVVSKDMAQFKQIDIGYRFRFNPELDYKIYMASGILVILVTVVSMFLSALNLVREKEIGTMEQINVTPIRKYQFIIAKLMPFLIIALVELAFGLVVAKILFNLPMLGSLPLLFGVALVYLTGALGLGLLVSIFSESQQQVMFMSFFVFIIFILMSGIFTTTESMPQWGQWLNTINPVYYFMRVVRMILLKGSGFSDFASEVYALLIYAFVSVALAVRLYRKRA